jgi:hypothetical protein
MIVGPVQIKMRLMWWDALCNTFGHQWKMRGENWAAYECERCHRKRLMLVDRVTSKTEWIITP